MVHAQPSSTPSNPIVDKCIDSTIDVLAQMRPVIEKYRNAPPIENLVLFVPKADYSANAMIKFRRIEISYAMCYEILLNADAVAVVREAFPEQGSKLTAYSKEVSRQAVIAEAASEPGNIKWPNVQRFLSWVGIGRVSVPMTIANNIERRSDMIIHDELAIIIGHEIAHLISNDQAGPTVSRETMRMQEVKADVRAYEFASKIFTVDDSPAALFPMFGLLNRMHSHVPSTLDTHPLVECRIAYYLRRSSLINRLSNIELRSSDKAYLVAILTSAKNKTGFAATTFSEIVDMALLQPECKLYQDENN